MTAKEELRRLVEEELDEEAAREALEYVRWLLQDSETLTEEEIARIRTGEAELQRGERVSWDELRRGAARD